MVRGGRSLKILQVAADAGRAGQRVGTGRTEGGVMALCTLQRTVRPGQGESGAGVIKGGARPRSGVVALLTGLGKAGLHMVRGGRSLKILQVAADAGRAGQRVGTGRTEGGVLALWTLRRTVGPGQGESGAGVIKGGAR